MKRIFLFFSKKRASPKIKCLHQGSHYNLKEIYDAMNAEYFEGKLSLRISWSKTRNIQPRRRIVLGSYHQDQALIRINQRLDAPHIPYSFISFIVYHEMLHHVLPPLKRSHNGRRIHHLAFTEREAQFKHYAEVKALKKSLKNSWFATRSS